MTALRGHARLLALTGAALVCDGALSAGAAGALLGPSARLAAAVVSFNLGQVELPQPDTGRFAVYPTELKGVIGVPSGVRTRWPIRRDHMHGRHGTGCPEMDDLDTVAVPGPVERRHDLGFRYLGYLRRHAVASSRSRSNANAADTNGLGRGEGEPDGSDPSLEVLRASGGGERRRRQRVRRAAGREDRLRSARPGRPFAARRARGPSRSRGAAWRAPAPVGRRARADPCPAPARARAPARQRAAGARRSGSCSRNATTTSSVSRVSRTSTARDWSRRARPAALVYLRRANHNFFNSALADEGGHGRRGVASLARAGSREPAQTGWLARYAPGVLPRDARGRAGRARSRESRRCRAAAALCPWPSSSSPRSTFPAAIALCFSGPAGPGERSPDGGGRPAERDARRDCPLLPPGSSLLALGSGSRRTRDSWSALLASRRGGTFANSFDAPRGCPRSFDAVPAAGGRSTSTQSEPTRAGARRRSRSSSATPRGRTAPASPVRRTAPALGFPPGRLGPGTEGVELRDPPATSASRSAGSEVSTCGGS